MTRPAPARRTRDTGKIAGVKEPDGHVIGLLQPGEHETSTGGS
jgi:hypothetical protein